MSESESSENTQTEMEQLHDQHDQQEVKNITSTTVVPVNETDGGLQIGSETETIEANIKNSLTIITESKDCKDDQNFNGLPTEENKSEKIAKILGFKPDINSSDILFAKEYEKKNRDESLFDTTNNIGIKYTDIFSIFQERLNVLDTEYQNEAVKTGQDYNWKELDMLYLEELNILTLPATIIECLNHYLPIYENLYVSLASIYIYNILAVKAWNEGYWLSHYNGHEINFINKENISRKTLKENIPSSDKKLHGYCFIMRNNFVKFCLENSYQELLACEEKIIEVGNIFRNLLDDNKLYSDNMMISTINLKKDALRKVNVYFELSHQRALDVANYKCQPIIIQFLKLTYRTQALHIPRYNRTGFNIRVSNQKPTIWNSNLVIRQQPNISTFTGFINGSQLVEHKIASDIQVARLASNTPPVFFEGDKPQFFNNIDTMFSNTFSNNNLKSKKCMLDPFVIKPFVCLVAEMPAPALETENKKVSRQLKILLKEKHQINDINSSTEPTLLGTTGNDKSNSNCDEILNISCKTKILPEMLSPSAPEILSLTSKKTISNYFLQKCCNFVVHKK